MYPTPLKEQKRLQVVEKKERGLRFCAKNDPNGMIHDKRGAYGRAWGGWTEFGSGEHGREWHEGGRYRSVIQGMGEKRC